MFAQADLTKMAGADYADEDMGEAQPQRQSNRKTKGRGFQDREAMDVDDDRAGPYDTQSTGTKGGPIKCESPNMVLLSMFSRCKLIFVILVLQL